MDVQLSMFHLLMSACMGCSASVRTVLAAQLSSCASCCGPQPVVARTNRNAWQAGTCKGFSGALRISLAPTSQPLPAVSPAMPCLSCLVCVLQPPALILKESLAVHVVCDYLLVLLLTAVAMAVQCRVTSRLLKASAGQCGDVEAGDAHVSVSVQPRQPQGSTGAEPAAGEAAPSGDAVCRAD